MSTMYRDMKEVTVERENEIKPGMTVRLKSGGPVMTVQSLIIESAVCVWFEKYESKPIQHTFLTIMLERVVEAK